MKNICRKLILLDKKVPVVNIFERKAVNTVQKILLKYLHNAQFFLTFGDYVQLGNILSGVLLSIKTNF